MPKDRNPWLADDMFSDKKTTKAMKRFSVMVLMIIITLGLFTFMGA